MPVLSITRLGFERSGRQLFDDLDLEVTRGEVIVILGASGSGKSSLLEVIFSGSRPDIRYSGSIELNCDQASLVLQDGALLDYLNVIENLRLVNAYSTVPKNDSELTGYLQRLNIPQGYNQHSVVTLSGGEKRRVAVARALVRQPELLFFDEPDAGLDVANRRDLAAMLRELVETRHTTLVIVTHDPLLASLVAHKVYLLEEGKLAQCACWGAFPENGEQANHRRLKVETLAQQAKPPSENKIATKPPRPRAAWMELFAGGLPTLSTLFKRNPSPKHYFNMIWRMLQMGAVAGAPFFLLVGAMMGATTIVVIRNLVVNVVEGLDFPEMARTTIEYFLSSYPTVQKWVLDLVMDNVDISAIAEPSVRQIVEQPDVVLNHLSGLYIAFFVPAIAAIFFVARSGSIISSWLGVLRYGREVDALRTLGVDTDAYLKSPALVAIASGYLLTAVVFGTGMWVGSFLTAEYLYGVEHAAELLVVTYEMLVFTDAFQKMAIYGITVPVVICTLGLAPKPNVDSVAHHTTMTIIYSTVIISIVELMFALAPWENFVTPG